MISRRKILALLGLGAPVAATALAKVATVGDTAAADAAVKAANPVYVYDPTVHTLLPTDPAARLFRLRWLYEHEFQHKWDATSPTYPATWGYAGSGSWWPSPPPEPIEAEHEMICGKGDTAIAAIDDWAAKLPHDRAFDTLLWRVKPELDCERDIARQVTTWRVFSRFARIRHRWHPVSDMGHTHPAPTKFPTGWIVRT